MTTTDYSPADFTTDIDRWTTAAQAYEADNRRACADLILDELGEHRYARMITRALVGIAICSQLLDHLHGHRGHRYTAIDVVDGHERNATTRIVAAAIAAGAGGDRPAAIRIVKAYVSPTETGVDRLTSVMATTLACLVALRKAGRAA